VRTKNLHSLTTFTNDAITSAPKSISWKGLCQPAPLD